MLKVRLKKLELVTLNEIAISRVYNITIQDISNQFQPIPTSIHRNDGSDS